MATDSWSKLMTTQHGDYKQRFFRGGYKGMVRYYLQFISNHDLSNPGLIGEVFEKVILDTWFKDDTEQNDATGELVPLDNLRKNSARRKTPAKKASRTRKTRSTKRASAVTARLA